MTLSDANAMTLSDANAMTLSDAKDSGPKQSPRQKRRGLYIWGESL